MVNKINIITLYDFLCCVNTIRQMFTRIYYAISYLPLRQTRHLLQLHPRFFRLHSHHISMYTLSNSKVFAQIWPSLLIVAYEQYHKTSIFFSKNGHQIAAMINAIWLYLFPHLSCQSLVGARTTLIIDIIHLRTSLYQKSTF